MARTTSTNYTTPSFPMASADGDAFDASDVQQLAAAVNAHDHTTGKGVVITAGGGAIPYLCYQDRKTSNTAGGTFTSGAWRTRDLNTEVADTGNNGSVTSNQITLAAGTYRCQASAPGYYVRFHQARLQDITHSTTLLTGTSEFNDAASSGQTTRSIVVGRFTLSGSTVIELQHQCSQTNATSGYGAAANFGTEVYSIVELWKDA